MGSKQPSLLQKLFSLQNLWVLLTLLVALFIGILGLSMIASKEVPGSLLLYLHFPPKIESLFNTIATSYYGALSFPSRLLSLFNLSDHDMYALGKISLLVAFLVLLLNPRFRRAWPEIGIAGLLLFTTVLLTTTAPSMNTTPTASTEINFDLPASKLQSDLVGLQPGNKVMIILISSAGEHHYDATLREVLGIGSQALIPPYKKTDAARIRISLSRGIGDTTALGFAGQLVSANAIFLLPST